MCKHRKCEISLATLALLVISLSVGLPQQLKGQSLDIAAQYTASGWMGDGEQGTKYIQLQEDSKEKPRSAPTCIKISYKPGPKAWGGIYWQNKPDNWGDQPGDNLSPFGYKRISFWARGKQGGEIVEFKAGGINKKPSKDSFEVSSGKITLNSTWTLYTISLEGKNLGSVIGVFCWVASRSGNSNGLTFYLDDILYKQ